MYNPIKVDARSLRSAVEKASAEAGWAEPLFFETTIDDIGEGVTRSALEAGVDAVLVAGGDGTVRAVSDAIASSGVPLTIVPSGTGNLLARNLRLPLTDRDGHDPRDLRRRPHDDRHRPRRAAPRRRQPRRARLRRHGRHRASTPP